jgi:hypothetical protein
MLKAYGDGSWIACIATPHGLVLAYNDAQLNDLMLTYVRDGVSYERWIGRATTARGSAIMAGKFVREIVNQIQCDKETQDV